MDAVLFGVDGNVATTVDETVCPFDWYRDNARLEVSTWELRLGSAAMEEERVGTIAYDDAAGSTGECSAERTGVLQKTRDESCGAK